METPASYVGLLGSRRKTILIYEELLQRGWPIERVKAVHAPIGLDIGGRTPEEIAISIMGEILAFRLGGSGGSMKLEDRYMERIQQNLKRRSGNEPRVPVAVGD